MVNERAAAEAPPFLMEKPTEVADANLDQISASHRPGEVPQDLTRRNPTSVDFRREV